MKNERKKQNCRLEAYFSYLRGNLLCACFVAAVPLSLFAAAGNRLFPMPYLIVIFLLFGLWGLYFGGFLRDFLCVRRILGELATAPAATETVSFLCRRVRFLTRRLQYETQVIAVLLTTAEGATYAYPYPTAQSDSRSFPYAPKSGERRRIKAALLGHRLTLTVRRGTKIIDRFSVCPLGE